MEGFIEAWSLGMAVIGGTVTLVLFVGSFAHAAEGNDITGDAFLGIVLPMVFSFLLFLQGCFTLTLVG